MTRQIILIERLTIKDAKEYQSLFHTYQQLLALTDEQVALAVSIAVGTCPYCWENTRDCQCWNDM